MCILFFVMRKFSQLSPAEPFADEMKKKSHRDDILKTAGVIDVFDEYQRREIAYHHSSTNLPILIFTSKHK